MREAHFPLLKGKENMNEAINICKNCGGIVTYDIKKHGLACSYCGTVDVLRPCYMRIKKHLFTNGFTFPSLSTKFSQYKCPNCNSITDSEHNNVTNCPSCGASPLALVAHLSVAPDGIIPFSLPKNEISNYFKQWLKKKIFAPRSLKKLKRFDVLKSIYYPVYAFDYSSNFSYTAVGIKVVSKTDDKTVTTRTPFSGNFVSSGTNDLISANTNLDTDEIKELGPFNLTQCQPFNRKYLFGFYAPDANITPTQSHTTLIKHLNEKYENAVRRENSLKYSEIVDLNGTTTLTNEYLALVYLPVWTASYTYGGKNYRCLINGTNGQISGSTPISKGKIIGLGCIIISIMILAIILLNIL